MRYHKEFSAEIKSNKSLVEYSKMILNFLSLEGKNSLNKPSSWDQFIRKNPNGEENMEDERVIYNQTIYADDFSVNLDFIRGHHGSSLLLKAYIFGKTKVKVSEIEKKLNKLCEAN